MTTRSPTPLFVLCLAVTVACGSDTGTVAVALEPERPAEPPAGPVFTKVAVLPTAADLFALAPGNAVQLTIRAYDQTGAPMPSAAAATYSSSAPAIAGVSSGGLVTAVAPGTAVITTTLALGDITRSASMTATVHPEFAGVYDLTALITNFDRGWGEDLTGARYTAVVTLRKSSSGWIEGSYADLSYIGRRGDSVAVNDTGSVTAFRDDRGQLNIQLLGNRDRIGLGLAVDRIAAGSIDGTFFCCGHISGTFTAQRRPEP